MPVRIAYQGEPGAFSEVAATLVRRDAECVPCRTFADVFAAVARGSVTYGVIPIENSIGGSIHQNYDLLLEHELPIVGEVQVRIVHNLLALPGTRLEEVRRVYSHPQALAQCEQFLRTLSDVEIVATYDTAGSAKLIRDHEWRDAAAIASERAAEIFGLAVLRAAIQDFAENITRFLVIGRSNAPLGRPDKTTIVFTVPNEPGALFKALSVFALRNIDLTKLESRPVRGRPWEYLFYADLDIDRQDLRCARALVHLAEFATSLKTLGSYPKWKEPRRATTAVEAPADQEAEARSER